MLRDRVTLVWFGLVVATGVTTWGLTGVTSSAAVATTATFVIAGLKVGVVMLDFMELRDAPPRPRLALLSWPVAVVAIVLGFWFARS